MRFFGLIEEIKDIYRGKTPSDRIIRNVLSIFILGCVLIIFYRHVIIEHSEAGVTLLNCIVILMIALFLGVMLGVTWEDRWKKKGRSRFDRPTEQDLFLEYFISLVGPPVLMGLFWVIFVPSSVPFPF